MSDIEPQKTTPSKDAPSALIKWIEIMIGGNLLGALIFTGVVSILLLTGMKQLDDKAHDAGIAEAQRVSEKQTLMQAEQIRAAAELAQHKLDEAAKQAQQDAQLAMVQQQLLKQELVIVEISVNVKTLLEAKGLKPINLLPPDAGGTGGK